MKHVPRIWNIPSVNCRRTTRNVSTRLDSTRLVLCSTREPRRRLRSRDSIHSSIHARGEKTGIHANRTLAPVQNPRIEHLIRVIGRSINQLEASEPQLQEIDLAHVHQLTHRFTPLRLFEFRNARHGGSSDPPGSLHYEHSKLAHDFYIQIQYSNSNAACENAAN